MAFGVSACETPGTVTAANAATATAMDNVLRIRFPSSRYLDGTVDDGL
jgi:hypothetical protein